MSKKIVVISAVAVVALLGVGIWWMFNSGRLIYVASGTQPPAGLAVCGSDVVKKYNAAAYYLKRDDSGVATMDEPALKQIQTDIKNKAGYTGDATCQTILFWLAVHYKDEKAADTAHKAVKSLYDRRIFADSDIQGDQAVSNYENFVRALAPDDEEGNL